MAYHFSGKAVIAGHTPQSSGEVLDLGFLKLIDTDALRGGWITVLDVHSGDVIQANQRGEVRSINPVHPEADAELNDCGAAEPSHLDQPSL